MKTAMIAAVADNMAIGRDNAMLWHISEDLKFFRRVTSGHTVIMGYNTFESIGSRPLPKRRNIVVTRRFSGLRDGVEYVGTPVAAIAAAREGGEEEVFIMGGGMMYKSCMSIADRLYITHVKARIEDADTFFPEIDPSEWKMTECSPEQTDPETGYHYYFATYERK
ncbi:MAG: dihydrofolate reductase [Bacteroidales bacterium]|nr:dihydrofolate reductase [Bacteroidales bacterium]